MCGDLAPRSLACLAIGLQQHEPRHSFCSKRATEVPAAPLVVVARGHELDARCGLVCCQRLRRWPNTLPK
eukprot:3902017-Prymnesium_polylepis.1